MSVPVPSDLQPVPDAAAAADELSAVRLSDSAEARAWCLLFGCSLAELEAAVAAVGTSPARIESHLLNDR